METQTKKQAKPKAKPTEKEKNFVIVDFLDIDPENFRFQDVKQLKNGSKMVPLRYADGNKDKSLYVKYSARTTPFGISTSSESKDQYKGVYEDGKKITGYTTSLSFDKDGEDGFRSDPYFTKAQEIDAFLIEKCISNSVKWDLGGTPKKPVQREAIEGYDEFGAGGKFNRLVKWGFKKDKSGERIYNDYPPRMEFGLPIVSITEEKDENGLMKQYGVLKPTFYDEAGNEMPQATSDNMNDLLPKFSKFSNLSQWGGMALGTFGASLKPKINQLRVYPNERLANDQCLLDDDECDDMDDDIGEELVAVPVKKIARGVAPSLPTEDEEEVQAKPQKMPARSVKATPVQKRAPSPEPEEEVEEEEVVVPVAKRTTSRVTKPAPAPVEEEEPEEEEVLEEEEGEEIPEEEEEEEVEEVKPPTRSTKVVAKKK